MERIRWHVIQRRISPRSTTTQGALLIPATENELLKAKLTQSCSYRWTKRVVPHNRYDEP
jgi:hypothetical protein